MDTLALLDNSGQAISDIGTKAAIAGSTLMTTVIILMSVLILGGMIFFVLWRKSFKYTVKIQEMIGSDNHYLVTHDKAKRVMRDGHEYWKLRRRKAVIPAPPRNSLDVNLNGFYYAECIHHEESGLDSGYIWVQNIDNTQETNKIKVITQENKAALGDRVRRANDRKSRSILDVVMSLAGMMMCVIIVVCVLAFYGEITKNVKETAADVNSLLVTAGQITTQQAAFQAEIAKTYEMISGVDVYNAPPSDVPLDGGVP
jgi:hypothetical protein